MARPETTDEVTQRTERLAVFHVDNMQTDPGLISAYAQFISTAAARGGEIDTEYSTVIVTMPKDDAALQEQLKADQHQWDSAHSFYRRLVDGEELAGYLRDFAIRHARAEDLVLPSDAEGVA